MHFFGSDFQRSAVGGILIRLSLAVCKQPSGWFASLLSGDRGKDLVDVSELLRPYVLRQQFKRTIATLQKCRILICD